MTHPSIAIGNFDGVHRGHQRVLATALGDGAAPLVVVTFWPHPVSVLRPGDAPRLICDLEHRIELLKQFGASEVRVIRFTPEVAGLEPEAFVARFIAPLEPGRVVVGENFRFGRRASGDNELLARIGDEQGFDAPGVALKAVDGTTTSSSHIREAIEAGDVADAADHLGRPFEIRGVVVVGDQRGREMGFPTANIVPEQGRLVPADGVYAGWLVSERYGRLPAAISVGSNPTFDGVERRVETYVLDRDDLELYGCCVRIEFTARLRGQVKFTGVDGLVQQMERDVVAAREALDR